MKQDVTVELQYGGVWHDITLADDVYTRDPIEITRGRADESSTTPPADASMTLDNRDGSNNPRNPTSPLYGIGRNMPARITVGADVRFAGEVSSWTPRRAIKGDAWTELRAGGILRRLGQGSPPVRSALYRSILGANNATLPFGYWPLEDDKATDAAASALSGQPALKVLGTAGWGSAEFAAVDLVPGSLPLPALTGRQIAGPLPRATFADQEWTVEFVHGCSGTITKTGRVFAGDLRVTWTYVPDSGSGAQTNVEVFNVATGSSLATGNTTVDCFDGEGHHTRFFMWQVGADVNWNWWLDGVLVAGTTITTLTLAPLTSAELPASTSPGTATFGHLAVYDLIVDGFYTAVRGYPGETAGTRFQRLCDEEGITRAVVGTVADTQPMGPQLPDTLVNLFREIETTDDGFIYDDRDTVGLEMRAGRNFYNQAAALDLDWNLFEVAPPTDPTVDDLSTRNDVTANRRGGSTARAVRETGPLNVQDPTVDPEGVGRYVHQVDVQPFSDLVLGEHASWHLARGTVDETRWPTVTVDLDATPGVDVSGVEIGDRLTITGMPAEISPDQVSLIVLGWSETIGSHRRRVTFTCAPESPFHIAEVAHPLYATVGSSATYRRGSPINNNQTTITLNVEEGPDWVFESAFDIVIGGERMTVTAVAAASGTYPDRTQLFTVIRSVNGVVKAHPNGSRMELFHRAHIGL